MPLISSISNSQRINEFPSELMLEIFSHLDSTELRIVAVCKKWKELSDKEDLWERIFCREFVFFGPEDWKKNWGDPGTLPKISYKQSVKEAFTFTHKWPKKWDKKMVWFQPKAILQQEPERVFVTPRKIGELVARKLGGTCDPSGYRFFWPDALQEHGDNSVEESCWVYMTPDVLAASRGKWYEEQKKKVASFGGEVPELVLAVTGILLKCLVTGKRLFSDKPLTYTRCKESTQGKQLAVGRFLPDGLEVVDGSPSFFDGRYNVAASRKFKAIST